MIYPLEGQKLPALTQIFAFGQVEPGSTLTINGQLISVHRKGGYLAMVPLFPGENILRADTLSNDGRSSVLERRVQVALPFAVLSSTAPAPVPAPAPAARKDKKAVPPAPPPLLVGQVLDEIVAVRTALEGGYDFFLYRGMKIRLLEKSGGQWKVQPASLQTGWVKESAIVELATGTLPAASLLTNMTVSRRVDSTVLRVPLAERLPYRVEQWTDPVRLILTLYGAVGKTDRIKYDAADPLIHLVRARQIAPDTMQITIEPTFAAWWGYDIRYEGTALVVEIRDPWRHKNIQGMPIAIDPGHGGSEPGAIGPLGTLEKDVNLAMAKVVKTAFEKAGAKPFLTREIDVDVPLYDRGKVAWAAGARLFISIHANSAGLWENPLVSNGYSVYFYHPQSKDLGAALHAQYRAALPALPDVGLFYADLAVCRATQMPAVLTEQAYLIVPEQEQMLLDPAFRKKIAAALVLGVQAFVKGERP